MFPSPLHPKSLLPLGDCDLFFYPHCLSPFSYPWISLQALAPLQKKITRSRHNAYNQSPSADCAHLFINFFSTVPVCTNSPLPGTYSRDLPLSFLGTESETGQGGGEWLSTSAASWEPTKLINTDIKAFFRHFFLLFYDEV